MDNLADWSVTLSLAFSIVSIVISIVLVVLSSNYLAQARRVYQMVMRAQTYRRRDDTGRPYQERE